MAFIRMERSANGDSEGPGCHRLDYDTELAHYRFAFDVLTRHPWIDVRRIVVLGNSLGSRLAPLVAQGKRVAGVVITAGGGLTYFERMVGFDRLQLSKPRMNLASVHDVLLEQVRFNTLYLLAGQTPEAIERDYPDLKGVWSTIIGAGDGVHYGRPYAFHQQAARKNFLAAWLGIRAPVLVVHNEFDQYETRRGAEVLVEAVNRESPGRAGLVILPYLNHSFYRYLSSDAALAGGRDNRESAGDLAASTILDWLRRTQ
jgi:pimeloyl-ACP methyl ester carboxylesterase